MLGSPHQSAVRHRLLAAFVIAVAVPLAVPAARPAAGPVVVDTTTVPDGDAVATADPAPSDPAPSDPAPSDPAPPDPAPSDPPSPDAAAADTTVPDDLPGDGAVVMALDELAPFAVVPGSSVDLRVTVAGPSAALGGSAFTYTAEIQNNSLPDADGATFTFQPPGGSTGVTATCAAAGGASCGTLDVGYFGDVSGAVGALPHLGLVTITVTGNFPMGVASVTASATVEPPPTTTDPDLSTNTSSVGTALSPPVADLSATIAQSHDTVVDGDVITYTLSYANAGPHEIRRAQIIAPYFASSSYTATSILVSCTPTAGATCPDDLDDDYGSNGFAYTVPVMPPGSTLVLIYEVTVAARPGACGDDASFVTSTRITAPNGADDPNSFNNGTANLVATADVPPCPETDLVAVKSQSQPSIVVDDVVTYTMTFTNAGPSDAHGASIVDTFTSFGEVSPVYQPTRQFTGCTPTGGAVCPTNLVDHHSDGTIFSTTIPTFPVGASVTITYDLTFSASANGGCGVDVLFRNSARIGTPAGLVDSNPGNNNATVYLTAESPACVPVDLTASLTQSQPTVRPGDVVTYSAVYSNEGPGSADGATIQGSFHIYNDRWYVVYGNPSAHFVSCVATGGAVCPTFSDMTYAGAAWFYATAIPTFPAGATLTVTYEVTYPVSTSPAGSPCSSSITFLNGAAIAAGGTAVESDYSNNQEQATLDAGVCADVAVNKSVAPAQVQAGEPVSYTIDVTNESSDAADHVAVRDPLPSGFVFESAGCSVLSGTATCGAVDYDPVTHTVTSTIDNLATGDGLRFVLTGTAGVEAATFTNTATATPTPGLSRYLDPHPASNFSQVNLQIFNTVSPITVTKTIAGLSPAGLPSPLTFTGTITCASQGSQPWSVTVPAGATSASAAAVTFWDGEPCVVAEDAPPAAPPWTAWIGSPIVAPALVPILGPATPVAVSVTNTLVEVPRGDGVVIVTKTIDGLTAAGLPAPLTFTGSVSCDGQPTQAWSATVAAGATSGSAPALTFAEGSSCSVTEDDVVAPAPAGYVWAGSPSISPVTTPVLSAGAALQVTVTNTLDALAPTGAIEVTKVVSGAAPVTGDFGFVVFCGDAGTFTAVVSLAGATSGSATVRNVPAGAVCTVTEHARAIAPAGFEWAEPHYSTAALTVAADETSEIVVTNPLRAMAAPEVPTTSNPPGTPSTPTGTLPSTGAAPAPVIGIGLLLVILGTAATLIRRRPPGDLDLSR